ncbi:MAG: SOS response-associated peptidase [Ktedonobacterales bacterium]
MCGRYALLNPNQLFIRFGVADQLDQLIANDDIRPTQLAPVVKMGHQAALMRWGLIPSWAKDPAIGQKMINARAEGLEQKPSFRRPLRSSRCLVPATSFYEWQPTTKSKIKYRFSLLSGEMFGLAGLYDTWLDPAGVRRETFTIITTAANEIVAPIHDRMPVILNQADEEVWLDPEETDSLHLLSYLRPSPKEQLLAQVA